MEQASEKDQGGKKVPEFKTFTVPFDLEEIKTNFSISTNTSSQPSKEQIINQAFKFQAEGKLLEAAKYYKYFLDQGLNDHKIYTNYGGILQSLGKLQEAELYTHKAIKINPNNANALANLGVILKNLGKVKEAELYTRKAIKINPNLAIAYLNLGSILKNLGKSQESLNLYLKVIDIDPKCAHIDNSITTLLEYSDLDLFNREILKNTLNLLLEKNNIDHKKLFKVFNFLYSN